MFASSVVSFDLGLTNTGRFPYALAVLDCGHVASVTLRDTRGACCGCGAAMTHAQNASFARCACGTYMTGNIDSPNPHVAADRLTQVGDVVECASCHTEAKQIEWLRALDRSTVLHSRFRHGGYHFYRQDSTSPSGKFLIGSVGASKAIEAVLNELRYAPLSPTEGLREDVAR